MSSAFVEGIPDRLREELDRCGYSFAEAARAIGDNSSQGIRDTVSGRKRCSAELLAKLGRVGVDATYVLTGIPAHRYQVAEGGDPATRDAGSIYTIDGSGTGLDVPLYDVEGAAGAGRSLENESVVGTFTIDSETLAQLGLVGARLAGIRVRGDSMEPTLFDGDWTFVNLDDTNFAQAGVFLVWVSGELRIKRVQRLAGGAMYLISDNTHYEKEMIRRGQMQDVAILGRVKTRLGEIS